MVYVHQCLCRHYFLPSVEFARSDFQCGQREFDNHRPQAHSGVALKQLELIGRVLQSHFRMLDPVYLDSVDIEMFGAKPFALRDEE